MPSNPRAVPRAGPRTIVRIAPGVLPGTGMARALRWSLGLALVAIAALPGIAPAQSASRAVEVTSGDDGRVSIRTGGASAADVAEALGRSTGIAVTVTGDAATAIDVDIVDEPLAKAVTQLAPNHLVMRADSAADSPITEIVLMMPDGDDGGIESTEFLPTGEPTDGVVTDDASLAGGDGAVDENGLPIDEGLQILRDPERAAAVRAAAASAVAAQAAAQAAEIAGGQDGLDDGSGIDPATGLPFDGQSFDGQPLDDGSGFGTDGVDPQNR